MVVTIFSPDVPCSKCAATKGALSRAGVPFVSVTASGDQVDSFKAGGHLAFPVVVVDFGDGASWTFSDYRHDDIKRLTALWVESVAA